MSVRVRSHSFPNSRVAPHQVRAGNIRAGIDRVSARDLGEDFEPNREQRRDYVRNVQTRNVRMHSVGWGRWRRHNDRSYESWAASTAITPIAPRRERRPAMIRDAKMARWLRRQQHKQQTLSGAIRAAAARVMRGKLA